MPVPILTQAQQIVTHRDAGFFGDRTVPDIMVRFPGIYRNLDGSLNIRGTGERFTVLLNGHPVAYSHSGTRSVFLEAFSAEMIYSMEHEQSGRPVMGFGQPDVINMKLFPSGRISGQNISAVAGLGSLPQYSQYGRLGGRASVVYMQPISDNADAGMKLTYQSDHSGMEELSLNFDTAEFGGPFEDVIRSVTPAYRNELSERMSGSAWFVWSPTVHTELTGSLHHFKTDLLNDHHAQTHDTRGDWLRPDTTGLKGGQGVARYGATTAQRSLSQTDLQFSGATRFEDWKVRYRLNWSRADTRTDRLQIPFSREGTDFSIDTGDRLRPVLQITGVPVLDNGTIDYRTMRMGAMEQTLQEHQNNLVSNAVDVLFQPLRLNAGLDFKWNHQDAYFEQSGYNFFQVLNLYRFFMAPRGDMEIFGQPGYLIPWIIDTGDARSFLEGNLPRFNRNEDAVARNSAINNFSVEEERYAAYTTFNGNPGAFELAAGLRMEHTRGRYEGYSLLSNDNGNPESPVRTDASSSHTDLLPFAFVRWTVNPAASLELGYSRGVNRADFFQLTPFNLTDDQLMIRRRGNPGLAPEYIQDIEVKWRFETETALFLAVGIFYRQLSNAILETSRLVMGGEHDGFMEFGYENSGNNAEIGGVELQAEHRLVYLSGALSGFTVIGNYTFSESRTETDFRPDETLRLSGHSRHHLNAALRFEAGRFASQFSYRFTSDSIRSLATEAIQAPAARSSEPIYPDVMDPDLQLITGSLRFRFSENFEFWTDAALDPARTRAVYYHSDDVYPILIQKNSALAFRAGIHFQF